MEYHHTHMSALSGYQPSNIGIMNGTRVSESDEYTAASVCVSRDKRTFVHFVMKREL